MARTSPSEPRARLFVALDLTAQSRAALAGLPVPEGMRALAPGSLHVTLVFLGSRPESELPAIRAVLPAGDARCELAVEGVRRLRHLSALSLRDDDEKATALQSQVAEALVPFHKRESRPWWPHVTLARGRGVDAADPNSVPFSITTESMTLYRSHPKSVYQAL